MTLIRKAHAARRYGHSWINVGSEGLIRLSHRLVMALDVKHGDFIAFYQDDIKTKDWYLRKEEDGLKINMANKSYFKVNSKVVAQDILRSIGAMHNVKIKVSTVRNGNGMFAILTDSAVDMKGNKIKTFSEL